MIIRNSSGVLVHTSDKCQYRDLRTTDKNGPFYPCKRPGSVSGICVCLTSAYSECGSAHPLETPRTG